MSVLMYVLGILAAVVGLVLVTFGIPVKEFSFGNTLILAGSIGISCGLVVFAAGAVLAQLQKISEMLGARPAVRNARDDTFAEPTAARPRVPFPPKPGAKSPAVSPMPSAAEPRPAPFVPPPPMPRDTASEPAPMPSLRNPALDEMVEEADTEDAPLSPQAGPVVTPAEPPPPPPLRPSPLNRALGMSSGMSEPPRPERPTEPARSPFPPPPVRPQPPVFPPRAPEVRAPKPPEDLDAARDSVHRERQEPELDFQAPRDTSFRDSIPREPSSRDPLAREPSSPEPPRREPPAMPPPPPLPPRTVLREPGQPADKKTEVPPASASEVRAVAVLKSGVVDGMAYTLYVDGSIEAELPQGTLRFASIKELREHLEQNA